MADEACELVIEENSANNWGALPLLLLMDFMFGDLVKAGLENKISDINRYSIGWCVAMLILVCLFLFSAMFTTIALRNVFVGFGTVPKLVINKMGITLPYENSDERIRWEEISNFYTDDQDMRGRSYRSLYITLKNRKFSKSNPFCRKNFPILMRDLSREDSDDINNAISTMSIYIE